MNSLRHSEILFVIEDKGRVDQAFGCDRMPVTLADLVLWAASECMGILGGLMRESD